MVSFKGIKIGDLIVLRWLDHSGFDDNVWHDFDKIKNNLDPIKVLTVGWVGKIEKDFINLYSTYSNGDHTLGEFCILKNCVYAIEKVKTKLTLNT